MPDYELKRISALSETSAINDTDVFAVDVDAGTRKISWETLSNTIGEDIADATQNKADANGTYPDMAVGSVLGTNTKTDTEPYFSRPSASIGDREFDTLVGGTLGWNQLVAPFTQRTVTANGLTMTFGSDGSFTVDGTATANGNASLMSVSEEIGNLLSNHVYYLRGCPSGGGSSTYYVGVAGNVCDTGNGGIFKHTYSWDTSIFRFDYKTGATFSNAKTHPQYIDLTTLFGPTIADYIYSLDQATAGAGVAWVRKYLPKDYYAYCAPTLKHVEAVSKHIMTGFNQFDKSTAVDGYIDNADGSLVSASNCKATDYVPIIGGQTYYVKTSATAGFWGAWYDSEKHFIEGISSYANTTKVAPVNARYARFTVAYTSYGGSVEDFCINFSNVSRNGEYEPYVKHTYPLDSTWTGRGIPKLDSSNKLYFDGDRYSSDGTVTVKYGIVDLGTLDWSRLDTNTQGKYRFASTSEQAIIKKPVTLQDVANILCSDFTTIAGDKPIQNVNGIAVHTNGSILIYDENCATMTQQEFKTHVSGVYLVYELATPTTSSATPYTNPQICDKDGTEEYVTTGLVPVGHETEYVENLADKLTDIPNLPTTAGNYHLAVTVVGGAPTYAWVADE